MHCRIDIDTFHCNGCGTCVEICPAAFRMKDATEKAEVCEDTVPCSEDLERAVAMCPTGCIEIETLATGS